jgi:hypothetical protein
LNEDQAVGLLQEWFILNPSEWRNVWNSLPENVKTVIFDLFQLRESFYQTKRFLLQLPLAIPAFVLPAYYNFVVLCKSAVLTYGLSNSVSYVQGYVENYVSEGLDRNALIHIASFQGVVGLS